MKADYFTRENNEIDSTAIIEPGVIIGKGNIIGPYAVIRKDVRIGNNNYIGPHVVIGEPAEYRIHPKGKTDTKIIIGNRNRFSEFSRVQCGILTEATEIGDDCYIMTGVHIGHDCKIGNTVTIAPNSVIGGSTIISEFANIGMLVGTHPRLEVGKGAMLGMGAVITKDIPNFETWAGNPARYLKPNQKAIDKYGR